MNSSMSVPLIVHFHVLTSRIIRSAQENVDTAKCTSNSEVETDREVRLNLKTSVIDAISPVVTAVCINDLPDNKYLMSLVCT